MGDSNVRLRLNEELRNVIPDREEYRQRQTVLSFPTFKLLSMKPSEDVPRSSLPCLALL